MKAESFQDKTEMFESHSRPSISPFLPRLAITASALLAIGAIAHDAYAQVTFQNLGFESAIFVPIPGDRFNRDYADLALPGWAGSVGTNKLRGVLYDNSFLAVSGVSVLDTNYRRVPQGNIMVYLDAGVAEDG